MSNELDLARLREPFAPEDIEWRLQQSGEKNGKIWAWALAYITNRAIMDRLDEVVGPENWRNEYATGPGGGVICGVSIRIDGEWVTKWDGADNTDIEAVKGGLSGAMKRAAVQWGVGRYLYKLDEGWATVHDGGREFGKTKDGKSFRWDPPALPEWALPKEPTATTEQLERIEALLERVKDAKIASSVRRRLADGLTYSAADDAIRFLEGKSAVRAA
jgi:hypothetical protein